MLIEQRTVMQTERIEIRIDKLVKLLILKGKDLVFREITYAGPRLKQQTLLILVIRGQ